MYKLDKTRKMIPGIAGRQIIKRDIPIILIIVLKIFSPCVSSFFMPFLIGPKSGKLERERGVESLRISPPRGASAALGSFFFFETETTIKVTPGE